MHDILDRHTFHDGELDAQRDAGLTEQAERVRPIIADTLPAGAPDFLLRQRLLVLGAADPDGRMWATGLHGPAGFLSAPDPATLRTTVGVAPTDPLAGVLRGPVEVGTLAVDLATRRRLRVNGRWEPRPVGGEVAIHQAFGNCPKYIQARLAPEDAPAAPDAAATWGTALDDDLAHLVATADTFFVATSAAGGVDVSHRGGDPGFVRVVSPTELSWPDYVGNAMMMTSGNLRLNPAAGLLFPDWRTGATLQLTGTAEVRHDLPPEQGPATGRETVFRITGAVRTTNAFSTGWSEPVFSRFNR